jgi:predicted O-methyltransferase YrrM
MKLKFNKGQLSIGSQPKRIARPLLLALSLLGGFQVMALEICGFRILQMNLGSSVVVTGTLLTLIMIVLAVGYYLGGTLARLHSPRALYLLLLAACAYTHVANVLLLDRIGDLALDLRDLLDGIEFVQVGAPAALLSCLLYGPPVLALSTISPCLIRLESQHPQADTGKLAGVIMSLSTAGSILGTLLASYVLIPMLGVRATAAGTNAALFVLLVAALLSGARRSQRPALATAAGAGALLAAFLPIARSADDSIILQDTESLYGRVRVTSDTDSRGRRFLAYQSTRGYWHSVTYPDEPLRQLDGSLYLAAALTENAKSMLILGSAAGGAARQAQILMPELEITGVDIDPAVHEVATKFFGVDPARIRFVSRDARQFVERDAQRYDFIVVDLFAGEFVPAHCITREFFSRVRARLNPGGVVFINTNMFDMPFEIAATSSEPTRVNRHLERTLREAGFPSIFANNVFPAAVLYTTPQALDTFRDKLRAIAADSSRPPATRAALGLMARTTAAVARYPRTYRPFTDAWSPELLLERKWNHAALIDALSQAPENDVMHPALRVVRARLIAERAQGVTSGAISDAAALVRELDAVLTPLSAADEELAARYLRFDYTDALPELTPHSAWAKLAAGYARIYSAGHTNDFELLADALAELEQTLTAIQPPASR